MHLRRDVCGDRAELAIGLMVTATWGIHYTILSILVYG